MTRTFLVDIDTEGDTDFIGIAEEIGDTLEAQGFVVTNVRPWSAHTDLGATTPIGPLVPNQQTQQT